MAFKNLNIDQTKKTSAISKETMEKCARALGLEYAEKNQENLLRDLKFNIVGAEDGWKFLNSTELTHDEKLAFLREDFEEDTMNFQVAGELAENSMKSAAYMLENFPELDGAAPYLRYILLWQISNTFRNLAGPLEELSFNNDVNKKISFETLKGLVASTVSIEEALFGMHRK